MALLHHHGTRRGWVVSSTSRPHFNPGKTQYPFYRSLGGPQGQSGRAEILVPTGIPSWTIQPLVSRYTDWATQSTLCLYSYLKCYTSHVLNFRATISNHKILWGRSNCCHNFQWPNNILFYTVKTEFIKKKFHISDIGTVAAYQNVTLQNFCS